MIAKFLTNLSFSSKKKPSEPTQAPTESFIGFKLKKAQTVKRQVQEEGLEKVSLKHHEFEMIPQEEEVSLHKSNFSVAIYFTHFFHCLARERYCCNFVRCYQRQGKEKETICCY